MLPLQHGSNVNSPEIVSLKNGQVSVVLVGGLGSFVRVLRCSSGANEPPRWRFVRGRGVVPGRWRYVEHTTEQLSMPPELLTQQEG